MNTLKSTKVATVTFVFQDSHTLRSIVFQSKVSVNMMYFGKKVHLSHDLHDVPDEVKVFQQHCGGENLCVYKGLLCEGGQWEHLGLTL